MNNLLTISNSRGRVLLVVDPASRFESERYGITYSYQGDGMGGSGTRESIVRVARYIAVDAKSSKASGEWAGDLSATDSDAFGRLPNVRRA